MMTIFIPIYIIGLVITGCIVVDCYKDDADILAIKTILWPLIFVYLFARSFCRLLVLGAESWDE